MFRFVYYAIVFFMVVLLSNVSVSRVHCIAVERSFVELADSRG